MSNATWRPQPVAIPDVPDSDDESFLSASESLSRRTTFSSEAATSPRPDLDSPALRSTTTRPANSASHTPQPSPLPQTTTTTTAINVMDPLNMKPLQGSLPHPPSPSPSSTSKQPQPHTAIDEKYWIKDMDTGKVYVLTDNDTNNNNKEGEGEGVDISFGIQGQQDKDKEKKDAHNTSNTTSNNTSGSGFNIVGGIPLSARSSSSSLSLPGNSNNALSSARRSGMIRDLSSGREMTLDEFGGILGYTTTILIGGGDNERGGGGDVHHIAPSSTANGSQQEEGLKGDKGGSDWAQKSRAAWGASASWVKGRTQTLVQRMNSTGAGGPLQSSSSSGGRGGVSQWLASSSAAAAGGGGVLDGHQPPPPHQPNLAQPSSTSFLHNNSSSQQHVYKEDGQGARVKVTTKQKQSKEFSDLRLVQTVAAHQGVVWTMKFSPSGRYLASAGQDGIVRVWEVNRHRSGTSGRDGGKDQQHEEERGSNTMTSDSSATEATVASTGADTNLAVIFGKPHRTYSGHKQDVLDLAWSNSHFLLSASMDKTVRLWHVSMDDCLRIFKHTDFVTAIDFHPLDDKLFISGSIDGKMRLWNIPEQRVVSWQDVHEMVTAVSYSPDGRKAVVGTMRGRCRFYGVDKNSLEYEAQLDVKNARGQHSRGKKITGLQFFNSHTGGGGVSSTGGGVRKPGSSGTTTASAATSSNSGRPGPLLITSNDSRIRLYEGYTLKYKYKGHTNKNTQIRASFSPGGDYVVCGSDDGWVYLWNTFGSHNNNSSSSNTGGGSTTTSGAHNIQEREKVGAYECFFANGDTVTVAVFAPCAAHRSIVDSTVSSEIQPVVVGGGGGGQSYNKEASGGNRGARGQVIVTAGYTGELRIYENVGQLQHSINMKN